MQNELLLAKKNEYSKISMTSYFKWVFTGTKDTLPSSLPRNFPNHTEDDLNEKRSRIISIGKSQEFYFKDNFVKTSKYEIWNFLPKFLFEEFNPRTKIANCYFLVISCLQCIRQISNTNGLPTTLIPLTFVVVVDAIFQILEDVARHRADKDANSSPTRKFDYDFKNFVNIKWSELAVGDVVQIFSRETIPSDVLIIGVSEKPGTPPQGQCYVETKSLDGETNLKLRNALPSTYSHIGTTTESMIKLICNLKGKIDMEHPNKLIESFSGVCDLTDYNREVIQVNNVLLRGCVLRNTDYVIGIVLNTGHDTKIMMSSTGTPSKTSILESKASDQIQRIIALLIIVCLTGASGQAIWNNDLSVVVQDYWYLNWDPSEGSQWIIQFFYFFLLHATFIPVSLYVSMSCVRFFQSKFMNMDLDMYYAKTDTPALVRTMTLNEELGQISHIFSDKTGTLTCNIMDFRKFSVGGISYGEGITEIGKVAWKLQGRQVPEEVLRAEEMAKERSIPHVSFYCPKYEIDVKSKGDLKNKIKFFFKVLATCHDVIAEHTESGVVPSASNPDDEAIVAAADFFGYEFLDREEKIVVLKNTETGQLEKLELIESIEFSSKRKRMSVIVRDLMTNKLMLMTKGADTVMIERLNKSSSVSDEMFPNQNEILKKTIDHMNQYSVEGLRCLLIAFKYIDEPQLNSWLDKYRKASTDISQIDLKKRGEKNQIEDLHNELERDLVLVGCTAIEDRLQDGVPECIAMLAKAGINIWMLTGDKEETAINIAIACNLLQPKEYMRHVIVNNNTCPNDSSTLQLLKNEINEFKKDFDSGRKIPRALVIDGPSLVKVMINEECKLALLEFGKLCVAVVGCRVSPDQKKEMVTLIKEGIDGVRTLAIGDGANDVAMIQAAHVGVGIKGEEGLQAVNSADFAIAQFRYLAPLLLKHGRNNYIRLCSLVIYMFYKNLFMSLAQFWFAFFNGFSGQKYYTEGGIQLFNVVFTSIPILILGAYDMDLSYSTVSKYPAIYQECVKNIYFTTQRFWFWLFQGATEGLLCALLPLLLLRNFGPFGTFNSFWEAGALCFTAVVIIVNFKMLFLQYRIRFVHVFVVFLSILAWFAIAAIINILISAEFDWNNIWFFVLNTSSFWMTLSILFSGVMLKDMLVCAVERILFPGNRHILQEMEVYASELKPTRVPYPQDVIALDDDDDDDDVSL